MDPDVRLILHRFYAPWCGHCQNLKPAYEKAAKGLNGLAQVAAINCDDEINKPFCGVMGVQGFPTLKIVKPSKTPGKPTVDDYQGPRTANGIIDAVKLVIPNHVKRISDKSLNGWLETSNDTTKAILFSDKGTTGALIKVLSAEFLDSVKFAQIRNKETAAVEMFGVTEFPTLILLPGGTKQPVKFEGPFSKIAMKEFLAQYAPPEPETSPKKQKQKPLTKKSKTAEESNTKPEKVEAEDSKPENSKPEDITPEDVKVEDVKSDGAQQEEVKLKEAESASKASAFSSASASQASFEASEAAEAGAEPITITLGDSSSPTESPDPIASPEDAPKPVVVPKIFPPIPALLEEKHLQNQCLGAKTTTCILVLLPSATDDKESGLPDAANVALASLAELADKHVQRGSKLFPFYSVPARNSAAATLRTVLKLADDTQIELIAVNSRRGWWRQYKDGDFKFHSVETWVDNIRFGEGEKGTLPEELKYEEEKPQAPPEHGEL